MPTTTLVCAFLELSACSKVDPGPGSPLNRVSFLRTNSKFLSAAFIHPTTSFILLKELAPLAKDPTKLHYAALSDIKSLTGSDPYTKAEDDLIAEYNSTITIPQLVFLGLDERNKEGLEWSIYKGAPCFALDVTPKGSITHEANGVIAEMEKQGLQFVQGRLHMHLPAPEGAFLSFHIPPLALLSVTSVFPCHTAAIFAQARSLIDWNARNPFCAQCGQPTLSINAGTKRTCPPTDLSLVSPVQGSTSSSPPLDPHARPPCVTRTGIHNLAFPRTDPTVIMAVVSADASRVLLGRQKRWPPHWYSTLAGFVEPAESVEEAVRREVWEESGVRLGRVVVHSTQPWPYPANLMIGAIAQAAPGGEEIVLEHDPELEDAKWVSIEEVGEALRVGTSGVDDAKPEDGGYKEGGLRLPPKTAIANQLLTAVVEGFLGGGSKM